MPALALALPYLIQSPMGGTSAPSLPANVVTTGGNAVTSGGANVTSG